MLVVLACALLSHHGDLPLELPERAGAAVLAQVRPAHEPLTPPKRSIRPISGPSGSDFPWLTEALGRTDPSDPFVPRFHIYSQERKETGDVASASGRMLLRLWQMVKRRWRFDNPYAYHEGSVDVYLCLGGKPGGEQFFGEDFPPHGRPTSVNTICIYDLPSFTNPLEMAREVAHEYGHAVLPSVGGFVQPEDWANGYLGEKLFLRWVRDAMAAHTLEPADAMQVDFASLDGWVKARVDPLVTQAATNPPNFVLLKKTGLEAMNYYHGLVLYADTIMPKSVAARSMLLIGSTHAWDYPHSLLMATQELDRYTLAIPQTMTKNPIWIPLGKGRLTGSRVLKREGEWAQIAPAEGAVTVYPALPQ